MDSAYDESSQGVRVTKRRYTTVFELIEQNKTEGNLVSNRRVDKRFPLQKKLSKKSYDFSTSSSNDSNTDSSTSEESKRKNMMQKQEILLKVRKRIKHSKQELEELR